MKSFQAVETLPIPQLELQAHTIEEVIAALTLLDEDPSSRWLRDKLVELKALRQFHYEINVARGNCFRNGYER